MSSCLDLRQCCCQNASTGRLFTADLQYLLHGIDGACCALQDVLKLYAFGLMLQALILIPYIAKAAHFRESGSDILFRLLDCIVHAAPLGFFTVMIFISVVNVTRLARKGIRLTFPELLRLSAVATVACFDKTGTLTGSVVHVLTYMLACLCAVECMGGVPT